MMSAGPPTNIPASIGMAPPGSQPPHRSKRPTGNPSSDRFIGPSASGCDKMTVAHRGQQGRDILGTILEVGVHHHDHRSGRGRDPHCRRSVLTPVLAQADDLHGVMLNRTP